jgi:hypothetical protein
LEWPQASNPNLVVREEVVNPFSARKPTRELRRLAEELCPGQFYPEVQTPVELTAFRNSMLAIGNIGRSDPDYRRKHGETVAVDLSGDRTAEGETIYKQNSTAPYFSTLVLNEKLCNAAQLQAEYQALTEAAGHVGPTDFRGANLVQLQSRINHFGYTHVTAGEAAGGWDATAFPHAWMRSDTHFRPWFNVGGAVREFGLGAAKGANGTWYFAAIGGLGAP